MNRAECARRLELAINDLAKLRERSQQFARRIDTGICHVSSTAHDEVQMSFGGVKGSGITAVMAKRVWLNSPNCVGSHDRPDHTAA